MKRLLFIIALAASTVCSLQAAQVGEAAAREVATRFFMSQTPRLTARGGAASMRLSYTAEQDRFYVYDRGNAGGFVVVAGDDRIPQVLGYSEVGDFSATAMPAAVKYWVEAMSSQIAYLQSHGNVPAHQPARRVAPVAPLLKTQWSQEEPYNNYCPTYVSSSGDTLRSVTGCVATAVAQVMNYYKWPAVGRGSHSYSCNVNNVTRTELSVDFSQSVYQWDYMLNTYNQSSSPESCDAVAKLMSDVGISMDMGYGSSSGASEVVAMNAMQRYFGYTDRCYVLSRDYYNAEEWDQFLVDELSAQRPILYCGYDNSGGHAFVLDGFNADGYYHVNWGWGGAYDGYYLVSVLAPSNMDFKYGQDGIFGLVPETQSSTVEDALHVRTQLLPRESSTPLGQEISLSMRNFAAEGNMLDTAGYEVRYGRKLYYAEIPMSMGVYDKDGMKVAGEDFVYHISLDPNWYWPGTNVYVNLPETLEEGDYRIKLNYSLDKGSNYDHKVMDYSGQEMYVKMLVHDSTAYLRDCFLSNSYGVQSFTVSSGAKVNQHMAADVTISYSTWGNENGPAGNIYLSLLDKDGVEVSTSEMCEVQLANNSTKTYRLMLMAPARWGFYDLVLKDESGNLLYQVSNSWYGDDGPATASVFVMPVCEELLEDFESMTADKSTSAKDVQGRFTTWNFNKSGVRAPGEEKCNGTNSVMMKKPSSFTTAQPLSQYFIMAQATFFNPLSTLAKYSLKYSLDNGDTWHTVYTLDNSDVAAIEGKSKSTVTWRLNLTPSQPAIFRISMIAGGALETFVDDFTLYYINPECDVNRDGEVSIADINAVVNAITSGLDQLIVADVNIDGEINITDINTIIDMLLAQ